MGRVRFRSSGQWVLATVLLVPVLGGISAARAASIDGAWASSLDACKKVFVKRGNATYLSRDADFYGSGFVVDGKTLRGKMATCHINSVKEEGQIVHVRATCATDISVSTNEFQLKFVEPAKVMRAFPGLPELDTPYYRCQP